MDSDIKKQADIKPEVNPEEVSSSVKTADNRKKKKKRLLYALLLLLLLLFLLGVFTGLFYYIENGRDKDSGRMPRLTNNNKNTTIPADMYVSRRPDVTMDYDKLFLRLAGNVHDKKNGYISKEGIPYHSVEDFIVEAVEYGKYSTSEAISLVMWMDAFYARFTKDWSYFKKDWETIDKYYIPTAREQRSSALYAPFTAANYIPDFDDPKKYPAPVYGDREVGRDPLYDELTEKYGDKIYLMHWLVDVDNWLGFGTQRAVKIKIFERGPNESTWETIPHPCWDVYGAGKYGFADLYLRTKEPQWKFDVAPDAEARVMQVMYWAKIFADEQAVDISSYVKKTVKMGDFLKYSLCDKYYQKIGAGLTPGTDKESMHYLISWVTSWGGGIKGEWAWRIGFNEVHAGYQNPMAAYFMEQKGSHDWAKSLDRQMEMIAWVQSKEGVIGGGVINDHNRPNGPFHGMQYVQHPVFLDPGSNTWAGWQYWLMERVSQYYFFTGDERAGRVLSKWVAWVYPNIRLGQDNSIQIPAELNWKGAPQTKDLSCTITSYGNDVGSMAALATTLIFWDRACKKWQKKDVDTDYMAQVILYRSWNKYYDGKGVVAPETRPDYERYWSQTVPMPDKSVKVMPWGATIDKNSRFYQTRPRYSDALPPKGPYNDKNPAPTYTYHRTWQQCQYATALAYAELFNLRGDDNVEPRWSVPEARDFLVTWNKDDLPLTMQYAMANMAQVISDGFGSQTDGLWAWIKYLIQVIKEWVVHVMSGRGFGAFYPEQQI